MTRPSWLRLPSWARLPERQDAPPAATAQRWARGALAAALAVAVIAGIVSYSHIVALGLRTNQGWTDSHLLPFAIDGLIVAGSMILAAGSALGWLGVIPGVAATLFANLQFGLPHGALSAAVSTWPAVAFTVACFMLERWLRRRRAHSDRGSAGAVQPASWIPRDSLDAAIGAMLATAQAGNPLSGRQLIARFELKPQVVSKVREIVLASMNGHAPQDPEDPSATEGK